MEEAMSTNPYKHTSLRYQIFRETQAMAEYALSNGKSVPSFVIRSIDQFMQSSDAINCMEEHESKDPDISELLAAHETLVKIVEPAKPNTILLLNMEQKSSGLMHFLGPVSLIRQMMIAAIILLILFIALAMTNAVSDKGGNIMSQSGIGLLLNLSFYLAAAGLGASFAALYKANIYITNGTFDPTYHASYWIRFFLGLIAGLILAVMVSEEYFSNQFGENYFLEKGIVRPLLAMLGGFSADLTYTVLNRLVEAVRSLFTGSPKDQIADKKKALQVDFAVQQNQQKISLASHLINLQQMINNNATSQELNQKVEQILKDTVPGTPQTLKTAVKNNKDSE